MSWLLVAFIPGLLMLATFGLDRLEAGLDTDAVSPADVNDFLEQAKADCAKPAARTPRVATYRLLDDVHSERLATEWPRPLPTAVFGHHGSNPEFQATRHAHPV
ncbi:hypothetical protein [Mycobacterium antarcticum]|uniref:hypothetical protein n=1 Tax=Mycolicibacterium sp. TUM20984 TaxID=3023368 RepID=UPI0024E151B2|nr:hypothetical protein [Mycolicibacterium sp. TUM20984]